MKQGMNKGLMLLLSALLLVAGWGQRPDRADAAVPTNAFQKQNGSYYYYVREGSTTFASLTANVQSGYYSARGVNNLMTYCPYKASSEWRGVPAVDFYNVNSNTGTLTDFANMVTAAHNAGITVTMYIGLLFVHTTNPDWVQAQNDKKNGVNSSLANTFRWSTTNTGSVPPNGGWAWSSLANSYYATSWGMPALDYAKQQGRDYAKNVLKFWMDKGVDGFEFDAPGDFWGMSAADEKDILITLPQTYTTNSKLLNAEGTAGAYTNQTWSDSFGFTHILINGDNDTESFATRVMKGTSTVNDLENQFAAYLDPRRAKGQGVLAWSLYDTALTGDQRALDAAVMAGSGAFYSTDIQQVYNLLSTADRTKYDNVFKALQASPAEAPNASRKRLSTGSDSKYYAVIRTSADGTKSVLNIYNFKNASATITVNLTDSGITVPQTPVNLATGGSGTAISSSSYSVTLPAYGYLFLEVQTSPPVPWTTVDDNASGWTYGGGWAYYAEPAGYLSTAHGNDGVGGYGQYTFTGTKVEGYGWKGPDGGQIEVFVDGVSKGTFSQKNGTDIFGQTLFSISGLSAGSHTVKIQQKNATGTGWTMIDYIKFQ
ncbi:hypothetical protein D7Z26_17455 [Cohnella endophytica]|uniref:Glycosyl hydrolase family 13 catalytic domain-containing protein n=1 Tax=Cohnella endophytica TaxID=2419778 RepID=A0A494XLK0_9BACL|nr:alpha-amylase family glycosyl hydrolase [Cohnella endophytica]RKP51570.1 hypothetical protein D7Z26_17455 [Cohnella endophytica]